MDANAYLVGLRTKLDQMKPPTPLHYLAQKLNKDWSEISDQEWKDFWAGWRISHGKHGHQK